MEAVETVVTLHVQNTISFKGQSGRIHTIRANEQILAQIWYNVTDVKECIDLDLKFVIDGDLICAHYDKLKELHKAFSVVNTNDFDDETRKAIEVADKVPYTTQELIQQLTNQIENGKD